MSEEGRGIKRKRVSVANKNQEISDPKRKRVLLSTDIKTRTYHFWYECMIKISEAFEIPDMKVYQNINVSCQIQSVFYSAHSHCRQVGNGTKNDEGISGRTAEFMWKGRKYSKPLIQICKVLRTVATTHQLVYKKYTSNTEDNWISVASAIFAFTQNFKNRMKEVRVGHSKIQVGKTAQEISYVNASDYGIEQAHQCLLEGSSFPPHIKSSTAQSLGPATLMVMTMEKGQEAKYGDKWKDALTQTLGTLPDKEMFVKTLAEAGPIQNKSLVQLACDIILLTTSKQIHRAYYAPCFLLVALSKEVPHPDPKGSTTKSLVFDETMPKLLNNTGRGLFATYMNKIVRFSYEMETHLTQDQASQLCFHSMFGTYTDNLYLLQEITNVGSWDTRNDFGDKIKGLGVEAPTRLFDMPKFVFWAKMSTAMQSNMMGTTVQEILPNSAFSGPTRIPWNKYLHDYYQSKLTSATAYQKPTNPAALREKYMTLLQSLVANIEDANGMYRGSTTWHKVTGEIPWENDPNGNDPDIIKDFCIVVPIKTFLGGHQPTE